MRKRSFVLSLLIILLILGVLVGGEVWYLRISGKQPGVAPTLVERGPEQTTIKIYFGNKNLNPNTADCRQVFPVERTIPNDLIVRRRAIEEVLAGPTKAELEGGYYSSIPNKDEIINYRNKVKEESGEAPYDGDEIKIRSVKILAGSAYIDFSKEMMAYGQDKCRAEAIRAQFNETVKQFPKTGAATILIEGTTKIF